VWRGVLTIENVAYTAPYQLDGRAPTLEVQANGALHAHSQIANDPAGNVLTMIGDFERTLFSSEDAAGVVQSLHPGGGSGAGVASRVSARGPGPAAGVADAHAKGAALGLPSIAIDTRANCYSAQG
jgi:hypothetical protein